MTGVVIRKQGGRRPLALPPTACTSLAPREAFSFVPAGLTAQIQYGAVSTDSIPRLIETTPVPAPD